MDNFTNLIIPTPEEYYEEFMEKNKILPIGAYEASLSHIKPIADYVTTNRVKQPSAASMDNHIRFDGEEDNVLVFNWRQTISGRDNFYVHDGHTYGSVFKLSDGVFRARIWHECSSDQIKYLGTLPTLELARQVVENAVKIEYDL